MALVSMVLIFGMPYIMDNSMCLSQPHTLLDVSLPQREEQKLTKVCEQWIRKPRQSSRRCAPTALPGALLLKRRARFRTSTSLRGWRARPRRLAVAPVPLRHRRRSDAVARYVFGDFDLQQQRRTGGITKVYALAHVFKTKNQYFGTPIDCVSLLENQFS